MIRWYKGFNCMGGVTPKSVISDVTRIVQNHSLGSMIPLVRCEKQIERGSFYFFIAIESENFGEIPVRIQNTLLNLSALKKQPLDQAFTLEDIKPMVGPEHEIRDLGPFITYKPPRVLPDFDPLDIEETWMTATDERIIDHTRAFDRLLLWLSAAGSGTRPTFVRACQTLGLDEDGIEAGRIFRRLRLLGHIESSPDGNRWSVGPLVLAKRGCQNGNGTEYILCGQRSHNLLQVIRQFAGVAELPQEMGNGPATVYLQISDPEELIANLSAARLKSGGPGWRLHNGREASLQLAQVLPTITEWKDSLQIVPGVNLHMSRLKIFDGRAFTDTFFGGTSGFYELWPLEEHNTIEAKPKLRIFYDSSRDVCVRGDWYGLRFLATQLHGAPCPGKHYANLNRLALPADYRWPELYERALILASGRLPRQSQNWLIYETISETLLQVLSTKMTLEIETRSEGNDLNA